MNHKNATCFNVIIRIFALMLFLVASLHAWGSDVTRNTIVGRVVDEINNPIANVLIKARPLKCVGMRRALMLETRSDKNGRYTFSNAIAGEEYLLELHGAGFGYKTDSALPGASTETATVLRAQPTHKLSGRVLHLDTNQGVAKAEVILIGEKVYKKTVVSDDEGRFFFSDVPRNIGQGVIYAKKQKERSEYSLVRKGTTNINLILDGSCRIGGLVISKTTGEPISGCLVQAKPRFMSGFVFETTTGENGAYAFGNLPRGKYLVWVRHADWFEPPNRGDRLWPPRIEALPGKAASYNVSMLKKATISGRVVGPDKLPISGAIVSVKSAVGSNHRGIFDISKTDEEGIFKVRTGELGNIGHSALAKISAVADELGMGSVTLKDLREGEVRNGIQQEAVIQLSGSMSISGHVKDPTGNPIPGVYVYIHRGQWPNSKTDDSGYFQLNTFPLPTSPNKDFNVHFMAPRPHNGQMNMVTSLDKRKPAPIPASHTQYYLHKTTTAVAKHNNHVELNTVLTPTRQLHFTGQVTDPTGAPAVQANLVLFAGNVPANEWRYKMHPRRRRGGFVLGDRSHAAICRTVTDEKGRYAFCVARETTQSLSIEHLGTRINPTVFSLAAESLDGATKLLHDFVVSESEYRKIVDISLVKSRANN